MQGNTEPGESPMLGDSHPCVSPCWSAQGVLTNGWRGLWHGLTSFSAGKGGQKLWTQKEMDVGHQRTRGRHF